MSNAIPLQGGYVWDEHRNSSRVFPVPPDALPNALRALTSLDPALRRWIEDGHPNLTDDEHFRRFGEPFKATRSKKAA